MKVWEKIKSRFQKKIPLSPFQEIYKDKQGNKWYVLKNPAHLSAERALAAWAYMEDSKYSLTRENLKTILENINQALNKQDISTTAKLIGVIESSLELYCNEEILINLASVYCFLNDEQNNGIVDYIQKEKRTLWESDKSARSFFLQYAYRYTARYSEQQQLNVRKYLDEVKPVLNDIRSRLMKEQSQSKDSDSSKS